MLTLNRPATRNTLSEAMLAALTSRVHRDRRRPCGARRRADRQGAGVFRRPRSQGTERTAQRPGSRPRLFRAHHADLQRHDDADRPSAAAGDRGRARDRDRRRLPAGGELRSRGRLGRGKVRRVRHQCRAVLLDADGGAVAQRRAQARDGNAADRRSRFPPSTRMRIGLVNQVVPAGRNSTRRSHSRARSRRNPPTW